MNLFQHAFVLNLPTRHERLVRFQTRAFEAGLRNVNVFSAFLPPSGRRANKRHSPLSGGPLGCLLSHLAVLKLARTLNYPQVAVFEDDAIFHPQFLALANAFAAELPNDWDVYLPGSMSLWGAKPATSHLYTPSKVVGAQSYVVNARAYEPLIERLSSYCTPVDLALCGGHPPLAAYGVLPSLTSQEYGASDTGGSREDFSRTHNWAGNYVHQPRHGALPGQPVFVSPAPAWRRWTRRLLQAKAMLGWFQMAKLLFALCAQRETRVKPRGIAHHVVLEPRAEVLASLYHSTQRTGSFAAGLEFRPSAVLHLGAFKGFTTLALINTWPEARIYAVTDNMEDFPALQANLRNMANVTVVAALDEAIQSTMPKPAHGTSAEAPGGRFANDPNSGVLVAGPRQLSVLASQCDVVFVSSAHIGSQWLTQTLADHLQTRKAILIDDHSLPSGPAWTFSSENHELREIDCFKAWRAR